MSATNLPQSLPVSMGAFPVAFSHFNTGPLDLTSCSHQFYTGSSPLKRAILYYVPEYSYLIYGTNWTYKINQCFPALRGYAIPNLAWC